MLSHCFCGKPIFTFPHNALAFDPPCHGIGDERHHGDCQRCTEEANRPHGKQQEHATRRGCRDARGYAWKAEAVTEQARSGKVEGEPEAEPEGQVGVSALRSEMLLEANRQAKHAADHHQEGEPVGDQRRPASLGRRQIG